MQRSTALPGRDNGQTDKQPNMERQSPISRSRITAWLLHDSLKFCYFPITLIRFEAFKWF
jgi:hypothetical protein